jgi:hypothetical protein
MRGAGELFPGPFFLGVLSKTPPGVDGMNKEAASDSLTTTDSLLIFCTHLRR